MASVFACLLFFNVQAAQAADPWKTGDKVIYGIYLSALAVDYSQTSYFLEKTNYEESNPLLGKHPSQGQVNFYFISAAIIPAILAHFIPGKYRTPALGLLALLEIRPVLHNAITPGIGFRLPF